MRSSAGKRLVRAWQWQAAVQGSAILAQSWNVTRARLSITLQHGMLAAAWVVTSVQDRCEAGAFTQGPDVQEWLPAKVPADDGARYSF